MPNWSDPLEIVKDFEILAKVTLVLLGLTTWEIIVQLPFDWSIISRKREAHWPVFIYFICRYSIWFTVICGNVIFNVTTKINCQALYAFSLFALDTSMGCASILLMLRTIAVWNRARIVTIPLVILSLGHWGLLLHGVTTVKSTWNDIAGVCGVHSVDRVFVETTYIYTMLFDFIVLVLTTIGLTMSPTRSSLWQLLFRQGIIYFIVAFVANMLPTIFALLDLNTPMNMMFCVAAGVASSIVACRSFVSLTTFRQKGVYIPHSSQRVGSGAGGGTPGADAIQARAGVGGSPAKSKSSGGKMIAGIAFRSTGTSSDTMQSYHMDGADTTRTSGTVVLDWKSGDDFGSETGGVTVHTEKIVTGRVDGVQSADDVDLEKAESLSYEHGK